MNTQRLLRIAISDPDAYVIRTQYESNDGSITKRIISPIRFVGTDSILALCLCREEPRRFVLSRCSNIKLVRAEEFLMPVEIIRVA